MGSPSDGRGLSGAIAAHGQEWQKRTCAQSTLGYAQPEDRDGWQHVMEMVTLQDRGKPQMMMNWKPSPNFAFSGPLNIGLQDVKAKSVLKPRFNYTIQ